MRLFADIDSAIVASEIVVTGEEGDEILHFPSPNTEYKHGLLTNEFSVNKNGLMLFAAKDGIHYEPAFAFYSNGEEISRRTIHENLDSEGPDFRPVSDLPGC